jgi:hypothetical protein
VDLSYYALRALAAVGVVWDLRTPPPRVRRAHVEGGTAAEWIAGAGAR